MKLKTIVTSIVFATGALSILITNTFANSANSPYQSPAERLEKIVTEINKNTQEVHQKSDRIYQNYENWLTTANNTASGYSWYDLFISTPAYVQSLVDLTQNSQKLRDDLENCNYSKHGSYQQCDFNKIKNDVDEYHQIMTKMMTGKAQPAAFSASKLSIKYSLLNLSNYTPEEIIDIYSNTLKYAYQVPMMIATQTHTAYKTLENTKNEYKSFTPADCIIAVKAARETKSYIPISNTIFVFDKIVSNSKWLQSIKQVKDANDFLKFYYQEEPAKICNYNIAKEQLKDNALMNSYMTGYEEYKNLVHQMGLDNSDTKAYPAYVADSALSFVATTEYKKIIEILKTIETQNQDKRKPKTA